MVTAVIAALLCLVLPSIAAAQVCPPFDGGMSFPNIHGSEDPEDYCWEVVLYEGQELRQMSETEAAVFYESGHEAFRIIAEHAHDAIGTDVPTTLAVTAPDVITLAVHHRDGNPAADGAPFDYPITQGEGWEGGEREPVLIKGPPDEAELKARASSPPPVEEVPTPTCEVPVLQGRTVKAARHALLHAGCELGPIRGKHRPGARIVKQYRPAYEIVPAGTAVGVKLGR